jgi:hypothetical protein
MRLVGAHGVNGTGGRLLPFILPGGMVPIPINNRPARVTHGRPPGWGKRRMT